MCHHVLDTYSAWQFIISFDAHKTIELHIILTFTEETISWCNEDN